MSSDAVIRASGLGKMFPVYAMPHHRLLQMLVPGPKHRWYREFHALKGVDLEIGRGQTVGVVGRNGSGKSTLLQLICGTLAPSAGRVDVNGRIAALLELGAGFNPDFTGRENVFLYGSVLGLSRAEIAARFDDIAAFADIGGFIDQPVKSYSSGMYVRLAFAVAISVEPEILVVDEALSVGDEAFQRKCFARIEAIRDAGATVLFVSHAAGTVIDLCDHAILLDQGELLTQGLPKRVVSLYQRLIYAPVADVERVRDEIRRRADEDDGIPARTSGAVTGESGVPAIPETAYWDEGLVPASTVAYEGRGAVILDPHLETLDGLRVNVLSEGHEYVYTYQVRFDRSMGAVRCGMMIKSVTGVEIAGAATSTRDAALPIAGAGMVMTVRFRFRCQLAPGTYFLNAGVLADLGHGEEYVDRRLDVAMFRVMQVPRRIATGFVDLGFQPNVGFLP